MIHIDLTKLVLPPFNLSKYLKTNNESEFVFNSKMDIIIKPLVEFGFKLISIIIYLIPESKPITCTIHNHSFSVRKDCKYCEYNAGHIGKKCKKHNLKILDKIGCDACSYCYFNTKRVGIWD